MTVEETRNLKPGDFLVNRHGWHHVIVCNDGYTLRYLKNRHTYNSYRYYFESCPIQFSDRVDPDAPPHCWGEEMRQIA